MSEAHQLKKSKDLGDALSNGGLAAVADEVDADIGGAEEPQPDAVLDELALPAPDEFPVDALPAHLRDYARAAASAIQVPVDYMATLMLGALSSACAGAIVVTDGGAWRAPALLAVMVVGPSGTNKSGAFKAAFGPLLEFQREHNDDTLDERLALGAKRRRLERGVKRLEEGEESDDAAVAQVARKLAELPSDAELRYIVSDVTPEQALQLMARQHGRLTIASPEAGELFGSLASRGGRGPKTDWLLKGNDAEFIAEERKSVAGASIPRPALTLAVALQPAFLADLQHSKDRLEERGVLPRFLRAQPRPNLGHRKYQTVRVDERLLEKYSRTVKGLAGVAYRRGDDAPIELCLDDGALKVFERFYAQVEAQLASGAQLSHIRAFASKTHDRVLRVAGLLHAAEHGLAPGVVRAETLTRGAAIMQYYVRQQQASVREMYLRSEASAELSLRELLVWMGQNLGREQPWFTDSEIFERARHRKHFARKAQLRAALDELVREGLLVVRPPVPYKHTGRRPPKRYDVAPLLRAQRVQRRQP